MTHRHHLTWPRLKSTAVEEEQKLKDGSSIQTQSSAAHIDAAESTGVTSDMSWFKLRVLVMKTLQARLLLSNIKDGGRHQETKAEFSNLQPTDLSFKKNRLRETTEVLVTFILTNRSLVHTYSAIFKKNVGSSALKILPSCQFAHPFTYNKSSLSDKGGQVSGWNGIKARCESHSMKEDKAAETDTYDDENNFDIYSSFKVMLSCILSRVCLSRDETVFISAFQTSFGNLTGKLAEKFQIKSGWKRVHTCSPLSEKFQVFRTCSCACVERTFLRI